MIVLGPYVNEQVLRGMFVNVPYSFLRSFKRRFKAALRRRDSLRKGYLQWRRAGRVWAIDFTEPAANIDGPFNRLLVVRDLASGATLAAVPTVNETGRAVRTILAQLFALHGAPLVLKSDNGGAFIARKTIDLLTAHGVQPMRSPVYRPQYNGACERGGGHLKARIEHVAATEGRPGRWNVVDVERGRLLANHTARPWGARGPTPQIAFEARSAIAPEEREAFLHLCDLLIAEERLRYAGVHGHLPPASKQAVIERRATKRTLLELGHLKIRGGPVSTPLSAGQEDTVS
jgi:transposase InsO family protein